MLQFPSREDDSENRVRGGVVHTLPEGNKWYDLDRHPGTEARYLVERARPSYLV